MMGNPSVSPQGMAAKLPAYCVGEVCLVSYALAAGEVAGSHHGMFLMPWVRAIVTMEKPASVLSQMSVDEFSPWNGRDRVAHGASHGSMRPAHTPIPPSPAAAREGGKWGERSRKPTANAVGYNISPLPGLRSSASAPGEHYAHRLQLPRERVQDQAELFEGNDAQKRLIAFLPEHYGRVPSTLRKCDLAVGHFALHLRAVGQNVCD